MMKLLLVGILLAVLVCAPLVSTGWAASKQQKAVDKALKALGWKNLCTVSATTKTNNVSTIVKDFNCGVPPPPPPCPTGQHRDSTGVCVPDTQPPVCPPGTHPEGSICVPDVVGGVIPQLNISKYVRVGVIGDVDSNSGWTTQLNLFAKYQVQFIVMPGDFAYNNGKVVLDNLVSHGFTKTNTQIAVGNHDNCSTVKAWLGSASCYGQRFLTDKVAVETIDANSQFDCSGAQFLKVKSDLESSDAWYNLVNIHQPFATVKSDHAPNGNFACYHAVFKANGVNLVAQAHNHNWQYAFIDGITYGVFGTGTHDTGGSMYPCSSNNFSGHPMRCITGTNGVTILDLQIDDPHVKRINGYFISNNNQLVDKFVN